MSLKGNWVGFYSKTAGAREGGQANIEWTVSIEESGVELKLLSEDKHETTELKGLRLGNQIDFEKPGPDGNPVRFAGTIGQGDHELNGTWGTLSLPNQGEWYLVKQGGVADRECTGRSEINPAKRAILTLAAFVLVPLLVQIAMYAKSFNYPSVSGTVQAIDLERWERNMRGGRKTYDSVVGHYRTTLSYEVEGKRCTSVMTSIDQWLLPGWEPLLIGKPVTVHVRPGNSVDGFCEPVLFAYCVTLLPCYLILGGMMGSLVYMNSRQNQNLNQRRERYIRGIGRSSMKT